MLLPNPRYFGAVGEVMQKIKFLQHRYVVPPMAEANCSKSLQVLSLAFVQYISQLVWKKMSMAYYFLVCIIIWILNFGYISITV